MMRLVSALVLIVGVANAASVDKDRGTNTCVGSCPLDDCVDALPFFCGFIPSANSGACGLNFVQNDCRLTCQQCKL